MAISGVLGEVAGRWEKEYQTAKEANISRYVEAKNLYETNLAQFEPGGGFGAGYEAQLERTKTRDVSRATQHQISSGLWGVETTGRLGQQWESTVGQPARLQLEDLRRERYGGAMKDLAGVIERREDEYPDFRLIADMYMQAAASDVSEDQITLPATKSAEEMYRSAMGRGGGQFGGLDWLRSGGIGGGRGGQPLSYGYAERAASEQAYRTKYEEEQPAVTTQPESKTATKAPATVSLLSQYNRYKKGLQKQGITAIADYETWYRANKGTGALGVPFRKPETPFGEQEPLKSKYGSVYEEWL